MKLPAHRSRDLLSVNLREYLVQNFVYVDFIIVIVLDNNAEYHMTMKKYEQNMHLDHALSKRRSKWGYYIETSSAIRWVSESGQL